MAENGERQFPMQGGPDIPWSLAERIYAVYCDLFGGPSVQSLERIAERGGFGWGEVAIMTTEFQRKRGVYDAWKEGEVGGP